MSNITAKHIRIFPRNIMFLYGTFTHRRGPYPEVGGLQVPHRLELEVRDQNLECKKNESSFGKVTQVQVNTKIHSIAKERLGRICLSAGFGYPISNTWRGEERRRAIVRELHTTHAFLGRRRRRRNTRSNYQKEGREKKIRSFLLWEDEEYTFWSNV